MKPVFFPGIKRATSVSLAVCLMLCAASCGQSGGTSSDTTATDASGSDQTTEAPGFTYDYTGHDLGGKTYSILNSPKDMWSMRCVICPDEMNGETINDAMFQRNALVMQNLNCQIEEINGPDTKTLADMLGKTVLADDDTYQAAYIPVNSMMAPIGGNWVYCLSDVPTISLNQPWWNSKLLDATSINGKMYFAASYLHLMGIDGIWCMFFNQSLMDELKLEYPYQLVRDGKWTLDRLQEYCTAAASLNGDDSYAFNPEGNAVYGTASIVNGVTHFLYCAGLDFVTKNEKGEFASNLKDERFTDILQTYAKFFGSQGIFVNATTTSSFSSYAGGITPYIGLFMSGRSLFIGTELKVSNTLRPMDQPFGVVPFPKLDESQEDYRCTALAQLLVATIPVTNADVDNTGLLLDALSYESYDKVIDLYLSGTVEQKGLRNEESIEMLHTLLDVMSFDPGVAYNLISSVESSLKNELLAGNASVTSIITASENAILDSIKKLNDAGK